MWPCIQLCLLSISISTSIFCAETKHFNFFFQDLSLKWFYLHVKLFLILIFFNYICISEFKDCSNIYSVNSGRFRVGVKGA